MVGTKYTNMNFFNYFLHFHHQITINEKEKKKKKDDNAYKVEKTNETKNTSIYDRRNTSFLNRNMGKNPSNKIDYTYNTLRIQFYNFIHKF